MSAALIEIRFPSCLDPLACEGEGGAGGEAGTGDGGQGGAGTGEGAGAGLLTGQAGAGAAGAGSGGQEEGQGAFTIPEKFLVKGEDGKEDWQQIAKKALPAYSALEKRLGAGEAPPESADKYKIENYLPEGFERNPEREKGVLTKLHPLGLNNKQAQGVLGLFGELLGSAVAEEKASMDAAMGALKTEWKESYDKNLGRANFALSNLADPDTVAEITGDPKLMNNPALIKLLAKMGENLEDDTDANQIQGGEIEEIDQLKRSAAYLDEKHPDHARTVAKVSAAYSRGYKDKH